MQRDVNHSKSLPPIRVHEVETNKVTLYLVLSHDAAAPNGLRLPHCVGFTIILSRTTVGRPPLKE